MSKHGTHTASQGTDPFVIFSIGIPDTLQAAYRQTSMGDVIGPKDRAMTMKITKNRG